MLFALYKFAPALVSSGIRWWTHSLYSHVAIQFDDTDGVVFEAVAGGFVRSADLRQRHEPGLLVDLFGYRDALAPAQEHAARSFCESIENNPYDFKSIAAWPMGWAGDQDPKAWFCSEAASAMANAIGRPLQFTTPSNMSPRDVAISLALEWKYTLQL